MSIEVKYRLKEVAADFGKATKEISEILAKYGDKPKSTSQALNTQELNIVFEYLTQHNQIGSLAEVFAVAAKAPAAAPKEEAVKEETPKPAEQNKHQAKPAAAPKAEA